MEDKSQTAAPANEGEGNTTAAREYNETQRRFVKSGKVEEGARDPERALDGPERRELEEAEAIGKSRMAEEDPQITRPNDEKIKMRAYEIWEREGRPDGREDEHWHRAEKDVVEGRN
jgi:hypothetical protein